MSMHAMLMGTLTGDAVRRTGQSGREFVTATMRVPCDGAEAFLASLIAISATAAAALAAHVKGDTIVCGGRAELKSWTDRQGNEAHGLGIVVEQLMSEYGFGKRRKAVQGGDGDADR